MNKYVTFSLVALLTLFLSFNLFAASAGDFQSKQSGNWADITSWQTYDGTTWNDAVAAPTGSSGTITIQSGHTITVAAPLTINSGIPVIVNGYLKATAAITATTSVPYSFTFNNGSTYEHALASGSIPMSIWNSGSTCIVSGTTGTSPGNNAQSFYNFTWNCPGQTTNLNLSWDSTAAVPVAVSGDLTVTASGTAAAYQFRMTNAATTRNIKINGNVIVNGGYLTVSGSSGAAQYNVTVGGSITVSSGKFNLCGGSGGFGTWYLNGDFSATGTGQFVLPSNKAIGTILIFSKSNGTQNFSYTSSNANQNLSYGVMNNSAVQLNAPIAVGSATNPGYLVLTNGKFITSATNIITVAATSVVSGSGYIDGPLASTVAVNTSKVLNLPLGKGSVSRPVTLTLTQDAATSTVYTAELKESPVPSYTLPFALDAVSTARYVHIVKGTGANVSSATIQLSYNTNDGVDVSNKDNIRIAQDSSAVHWINLGGSGTANNAGTILSNSFGSSTGLGYLTTNDFIIAHVNPASVAILPTVSTNTITLISTTFATSGGVISNDGNATITAKGVCWNLGGTPTTSDAHTSDGTTSTPFTSSITGLTAGNTYHVRAYATNSAGTAYGSELTFTTLSSLSTPSIVTNAVTNNVNTSATGSGTISAWGGSTITDRGICWGTAQNPTLSTAIDYNSAGAGGEGTFTAPIGGLTLGTTYYVCAYATNSSGTSYGSEVSFTTPAPQPDVYRLVKQGGTPGHDCDYTTITDAFNAVPSNYTGHWFIYVAEGTYYEKPLLAAGKINVVLKGQNRDRTIITYDDYAGNNRTTNGVLSNGTNTSYSVAIDAADFQAQDITFQNTSNAYAPGVTSAQAVALRTNGDRQSYYNCRMLGYQDTYYTQGGLTGPDRIYNYNCYVEGSVDFIFGHDVALFDNCTIYCNRQGGVLTAGATEFGYSYGYVFLNSTIGSTAAGDSGADSKPMTTFYLGRPWQNAPKTVYINCYEPATVNIAGWTVMGPNPSLYSEYGCYGPGAQSRAVMNSAWPGANQPQTITDVQASTYTIANIFSKNNKGSGYSYAANWTPSLIYVDGNLFSYVGLPVELSSFTAETKDASVLLKWNTSTEKNSSSFEVYKKKADSDTWQKIASVKAANLSNSPKSYSFTDKNVNAGKYSYRLKMLDNDGTYSYSSIINAAIAAPASYNLSQNYPNPWNPSTRISYSLAFDSNVKLIIYNSLGQTVNEIVSGVQGAGSYETTFDAKLLSSGVYFYSIKAVSLDGKQNFTSTKKMILVK
ncbi:MAG: pectinesterase family protein [Ignavibacteriaceae bacterium]|nr:pectinesterase family protein [Ignavibacteriaceae bacterium]